MTTAQNDYAPAWHAWIAENLIRGALPKDIEEQMVKEGIDAETAARAVERAVEHPYIKGALTAVAAGLPATASAAAAAAIAEGDDAKADDAE